MKSNLNKSIGHNSKNIFNDNFWLWCLVFLFIFVMIPFLNFGFSNDDATNSLLKDVIKTLSTNPFDFAAQEVIQQFVKGRVQPVGLFLNNLLWSQQPDLLSYWIFRLITNFLAIASFALLTTLWELKWREGLSFAFLFILFIQARTTHEPIANYGYLPIITSLGFLGLYFGIKGIRNQHFSWLLLSNFILLIDVLYYEISLCFFAILFFLSWPKNKRAAIIFTFIPLAYLGFVIWVRKHYSAATNTMSLNQPLDFIPAIIHQIGGMLPVNHLLFRWPSALKKYLYFPGLGTVLVALLGGVATYLTMQLSSLRRIQISEKYHRELVMTALGVILIPTFFIVIVERYRQSLQGGAPYIPVYLGYFGFLFILLMKKRNLNDEKKWKKFSCVCAIIVALQFYQNTSVAQIENYRWYGFRLKLEEALKTPPLNELLNHTKIYLKGSLCDWYKFPYININYDSRTDFWFYSQFGRGPKTQCLSNNEELFPQLEMQELVSERRYRVQWTIAPDKTVKVDL